MKTVPVGLFGLQRMIALVRSLKAAASSSGSKVQPGGRTGTNRGVGAGEDAVGPVVLVERLREDHLVAGVDQREQGDEHRLGAAAGDGDLGLGVDVQAEVPAGVLGDRLAEVAGAPGDGVLVDVGLDRPAGGGLDLGGGGEVGHPLGQVHGAVLGGLDRHPADHALGEPRRLVREQGELHRVGISVGRSGRPRRRSSPILAHGPRPDATPAGRRRGAPEAGSRPRGRPTRDRPVATSPAGASERRSSAAAASRSPADSQGIEFARGGTARSPDVDRRCPGPERPGSDLRACGTPREGSRMSTRSHGWHGGRRRRAFRPTLDGRLETARPAGGRQGRMPIRAQVGVAAARPSCVTDPQRRAVLRLGRSTAGRSSATPANGGRVNIIVNGSTVEHLAQHQPDPARPTQDGAHSFRSSLSTQYARR